jgi:hypothetical protein
LFSKIFQLIKIVLPNKNKNKTSDIDETIESIKEIAEQEKLEINEEEEDNIISVTISNEFSNEAIPKAMDKKDLAAARKVMERKLEELKNKAVTKTVAEPALIETVVAVVPEAKPEVEIAIPSVVSSEVESAPLSVPLTSEAETVPPPPQDILNSFPAVVSEKSDDHTYMSHRFGAVDPYAVLESQFADTLQNGAVTSATTISAVQAMDDSWNKVKSAGRSGVIAYTLTELSFWTIAPVLVMLYQFINNGATINLSDSEQRVGLPFNTFFIKLFSQVLLLLFNFNYVYPYHFFHVKATIFTLSAGFLTFARVAVPARIALALTLIPLVDKYITGDLLDSSSSGAESVAQETSSVSSVDGQQG